MAFLAIEQSLSRSEEDFQDRLMLHAVTNRDYERAIALLRDNRGIAERRGDDLSDLVYSQLRPLQNATIDQVSFLYALRQKGGEFDGSREVLRYVARVEPVPGDDDMPRRHYTVEIPDFIHYTSHEGWVVTRAAVSLKEARETAKDILIAEVTTSISRDEPLPQRRFRARSSSKNVRYFPTAVALDDLWR